MASPFNMVWGSSISAVVIAYNQYGDSLTSLVGNGAVILTNPDAPTSLSEVVSARAATSITISWFAGANAGGAPVLDYRVSYAQETGPFTVLAVGWTGLTYKATGLTAGLKYRFFVQARNQYDYSAQSNTALILSATIPDVPSLVTTANLAN